MSAAFVTVANVQDLADGQVKYVEVSGVPVALCRVEGKIYAVGNVCTHDAGPLSGGTLDDHAIECPRHGARFDVRTGKVLCLPAPLPIPTYPVQIVGQDIQVQLP